MFNWLKKVWNKSYYSREDGHKHGERNRIERRVIKEDTEQEVNTQTDEYCGGTISTEYRCCAWHWGDY